MFRLLFGMALGWLAASWYYRDQSPMHDISERMPGREPSFEERTEAAMRETREVASELGEQARVAASIGKSVIRDKAEKIRKAAEKGHQV